MFSLRPALTFLFIWIFENNFLFYMNRFCSYRKFVTWKSSIQIKSNINFHRIFYYGSGLAEANCPSQWAIWCDLSITSIPGSGSICPSSSPRGTGVARPATREFGKVHGKQSTPPLILSFRHYWHFTRFSLTVGKALNEHIRRVRRNILKNRGGGFWESFKFQMSILHWITMSIFWNFN